MSYLTELEIPRENTKTVGAWGLQADREHFGIEG